MLYTHTWHSGHNMDKTSNTLAEKDNNYTLNDLGALGLGAMLGGPAGAALGLGANRLYQWIREKHLKNKKPSNKQIPQENPKTSKNKNDPEDLQQKVQNAQDKIKNDGLFEPEVYNAHKFYQTLIYDKDHPEENNFVYLSDKRSGKSAINNFMNYCLEKYKDKYGKFNPAQDEIDNYMKLVKERFKAELNKPCLITVPQNYLINNNNIFSMAKNSDILQNEGTIYYDRPSFDSNFVFDTHMSQYKKEDTEIPNADEYKVSLVIFGAYGREYNYAFDYIPGVKEPDKEAQKVILDLGDDIANASEDDYLYAFTRFCEQMIDNEKRMINKYTVAAPLLRKDSTKAEDLEYNAALLKNIGIYESEEEFIKNYMEDYQQLIDNQIGI